MSGYNSYDGFGVDHELMSVAKPEVVDAYFIDEADYYVAQSLATLIRSDIAALADLVDFSEKKSDLAMLNIVKNHLMAMRRDVRNLLQDRR